MRSLTVISTLMLLVLSVACTSTGDDVTSPAFPNLLDEEKNSDSFVWECRANMRTIASQAVIFYATNERYPNSLEELGMAGIMCPGCGLAYCLSGTANEFNISCPMPLEPNHGSIDNGVPSWLHDPEYEEYLCRENMVTIANQAITFFAGNNRYPEDLEELGLENLECPTCCLSYIYYSYEDSAENPAFYAGCPLSSDPNHGFIDNGVPSWQQEEGPDEDICRGNLVTITNLAVIFRASCNRYPRTLEEIGMTDVVCPTCNLTYELVSTDTEFYVSCPMPSDPNHGFIANWVPSWLDE